MCLIGLLLEINKVYFRATEKIYLNSMLKMLFGTCVFPYFLEGFPTTCNGLTRYLDRVMKNLNSTVAYDDNILVTDKV